MSEIKVGAPVCSRYKMVCGTVESKIKADIFGDQNDLLIVKSDCGLSFFQMKDVFVSDWTRKCIWSTSPSKLDHSFNVRQARAKIREAYRRIEDQHSYNALEVKADVMGLLAQALRLLR